MTSRTTLDPSDWNAIVNHRTERRDIDALLDAIVALGERYSPQACVEETL